MYIILILVLEINELAIKYIIISLLVYLKIQKLETGFMIHFMCGYVIDF